MAPAFSKEEYADRLRRVRQAMEARGFDALVIGDPANINWLTGYDEKTVKAMLESEATYGAFINEAQIHPNAHLITGVVCGYRVEEIEDPFMRKSRYLDKLVDELAKGKAMEKILRSA